MMTHSRSVMSRARVTEEELIKGWYLKRTPVTGSQQTFISLHEFEVKLGRFICSSPHISWEHVIFQKTQNEDLFIKDLKSVSGTFLNGKKIMAECLYPIHVGDRIALGKRNIKNPTDFEFEVCFTKESLKLTVTKIVQAVKCAALNPCLQRRHCNSCEFVEEKTAVADNTSFPRSCDENNQTKGTVNVLTETSTNQQSASDIVTRTCTSNECANKRPDSQLGDCSRQDRKRLHSSEENLSNSVVEKGITSPKYPRLKIDKTLDNTHKAKCTNSFSFGKKVGHEKQVENCIQMETNPLRLIRDCYVDLAFGKEVAQENRVENCIKMESDKPLENHSEMETSPLRLVRDCYVNLEGSKELVKSYMQRIRWSKESKWAIPFHSSSSSEEETTFFGKQKAKNVSKKERTRSRKYSHVNNGWQKKRKATKKKMLSLGDGQSEEDSPFVKQKAKDICGKRLQIRRKDPQLAMLSYTDSESDQGSAPLVKQKTESVSLRLRGRNVLCSDSDEEVFSFMKRKNAQSSIKHRNKHTRRKLHEENYLSTGHQLVKRKCFPIIDTDEEADELSVPPAPSPPAPLISSAEADEIRAPSTLLSSEKLLRVFSGKQNKSGDATSITPLNIPLDCKSDKTSLNSCSWNEEKPTSSSSDSFKKGFAVKESSIYKEVLNRKETVEVNDRSQDAKSGCFVSSLVKTKLELSGLAHGIDRGRPKSNRNSDNTEDKHTKFTCIEYSDGSDSSDLPDPGLCQSFSDAEEDAISKQQVDVTGPSKEKLDKLIYLNRIRKVNITSFTEALPRQRDDRYGKRSCNWISKRDWERKEVKNGKPKFKKRPDIRKKLLKQQGHRIRMPGGGSAIRRAPTGDASGRARIFKSTIAKPQINRTRHTVKGKKINNPIPNLPVAPKRAPKITAEQRFPSRQESLIKDIKLKTESPRKKGS